MSWCTTHPLLTPLLERPHCYPFSVEFIVTSVVTMQSQGSPSSSVSFKECFQLETPPTTPSDQAPEKFCFYPSQGLTQELFPSFEPMRALLSLFQEDGVIHPLKVTGLFLGDPTVTWKLLLKDCESFHFPQNRA